MDRQYFQSHVSEQLNRNLEDLFNQVLEMGGIVEQQLMDLNKALESDDEELALSSIKIDNLINREEMEIDRLCAAVLARQQPTGADLRLIIMAIRIAVDLERIGDEAVKVAKTVVEQCDNGADCTSITTFKYLRDLLASSSDMIHVALNGFSRLDTSKVLYLYKEEERMDKVLLEAIKALKVEMVKATTDKEIETQLSMMVSVRAAERITDHALNIAESLVYLVKGHDIRQMDEEALAKFLEEN